ncbi:hypothetical protein E1288_41240 [Saccharopolyspora elongata]|uniref:Knr4/Smi1-like domain-containing protein n=1 Tax=Saccharopolyspora elongata TaxID=2530387 RepID=A0A4R4XZ07_9PSEU|nr:hypothetical protein E1288_41240 [Saccharopolyspora elongata]
MASLLISSNMATPENIVPCTPREVEEVHEATGVEQLPKQYEDFLLTMGRRAGHLLHGTDFFYPSIVELADEMRELLEECGVTHLVQPGSVLLGMHQGGELYWMEPGEPSGAVFLYIENDDSPRRNWPSLRDFLITQTKEEQAIREKYNL